MKHTLKEICLFGSLDNNQLKKLENISTIKKLKPGNILFYEGDEPKNLYFLLDGLIKLYRYDKNDNINILTYYYTQSLIGEAATLQRTPHQITAECEIESTILVVSFDDFEKDFLRDPEIALGLIMQLVGKIKSLMNTNMQQTSMQKLAQLIFDNHEIFIKVKKYKIAEILNMAPETFSRNLKKLQKDKIISYDKNHFEIKDKEALSELFACCPNFNKS
ncbi:Crp/Fnr family transcriptional regulator [Sulfurospirillum arcachonense]|uniref:Crp/Fnr family transcriptional regulator n=1 Tax=Sulfurospirillum arcachonense TaxID=57666 RepID=UPI000468E518|nr:Crp/Fnr family transcriptional regulator [Sulfurospirillum arcachonense]